MVSAQNMRLLTLILSVVLLLTSVGAGAQQISPNRPPPPPPSETTPAAAPPERAGAAQPQPISPSTPPLPPSDASPEAASSEPVFDPLHAARSVEVGTFYMKKGNYDAAIGRFEDATRLQPSLAEPWKLMGEAYEKKHAYGKAVESYKKYLELFPGAEDAAKVTKSIAALEQKLAQEVSKRPAH
jgi:tetratricopeptide (TPR) repeat protein